MSYLLGSDSFWSRLQNGRQQTDGRKFFILNDCRLQKN